MPRKKSDNNQKEEANLTEHKAKEETKLHNKIKMVVATVIVDQVTQTPAVILKEENGERFLPIWIGINEANAIMMELEKIKFERPLTHDLMKNIFNTIGMKLKKIEVCDLKSSTYYAILYVEHNGKEYQIDSRPSDALALALRLDSEIYVDELVFDKTRSSEFLKGIPAAVAEKKEEALLEIVSEEDFGKMKM
ncbi:MAG: bifunctional nuclease family protein [Candidatus Calescibacterium sp.]|nr:bifunctional nuclease family protein [Candidatus Calescibacterium sp.]MCX7733882.1 bifunctional nuclease family protein [bacterium]MDW8086663.1 bifunctional nuclease family protein [Candidatus Calescibacterium sp.]